MEISKKISYLETQAKEIRKRSIESIYSAQSGHPGGSLSMAEILSTLFFDKMNLNGSYKDKFILSKGHGAPAFYSTISILHPEKISKKDLFTLRDIGSKFQGHPVAGTLPYVDVSTGSLGQGLSLGVGMAYARKSSNNPGNVYVILGDGEMQEGQNWEALMSASHHKLNNLVGIIDKNGFQNDGKVNETMSLEPLEEKIKSFGWKVYTVNGHDVSELLEAYKKIDESESKSPSMIIAETKKGRGIKYFEENPQRSNISKNGGALGADAYKEIISELGIPKDKIELPKSKSLNSISAPAKKEVSASREGFGKGLIEVGKENENVFVVDCDLGSATRTQNFEKKFPQKFVKAGIAEQNGVSIAAGLSKEGYRPFITSFGSFLTNRAKDQIMNSVSYSNSSVVLVGSHSGLAIGKDGATQMGIDDLNSMYGIPGMKIFSPADEIEALEITKYLAKTNDPAYLRISRRPQESVHKENFKFEFNKPEVLREGKDLTFFSTGDMTLYSLQSAEELKKQGIDASVVNLATLNPLNKEEIIRLAKGKKGILTLEDHLKDQGMGLRIKGILADEKINVPIKSIGIKGFGESGDPSDLYKKHEMDKESIINVAKQF